ncbi:hypothetical protein ACN23B_30985 (plasmid) [Anabaena sp. FACHB-709]|uniref:hypothetical protein n=1 Tax=Nostocaceae TaxID=1162 RepID=UPI00000CCDFC|nr:hypothetical protein [Nostoc sp. PCC 7120 = FACHB-418]RUR72244.1 hypothetical protein DSM107007_57940 [Nostoc sp. PCC 7120 = FACHB-418]BAB77520.1 asr9503 [Nostoc sp. PCC 7120 = FACHB-418]
MTESTFKDTLAHTQFGANADKFGGWDTAMEAAEAVETGDIQSLRDIASNHPEATPLIERIVTVSSEHR